MYIHYITPFRSDKNIGRAYNEACATAPEGSWICLRDPDTMFLRPDSQTIIEQIVNGDPSFDLIGCTTNRLRGHHQCVRTTFNETDLSEHIKVAESRRGIWRVEIHNTYEPIAGMFMLFRKELWNRIKFVENSIYCDKAFSADILAAGGKLGVSQGLYLFHLYRWGSKHPYDDIGHLTGK